MNTKKTNNDQTASMEKIIDRKELSEEEVAEYEAKAVALAKKEMVSKVHPVVQIDPETLGRHVCYLKEPNYSTKIRVMDKATTLGPYTAADELREACLLKEVSDPITYSDSPESDRYKMGVTDYCIAMVSRLQNQFKKK
jgi:hypothetical protein